MKGISSFDAAIALFEMEQDDIADRIELPTKRSGRGGRTFQLMQNGKVKQVRGRFGGDAGSNYDIDCEGRYERIQRELALQELRQQDDEGDFPVSRAAKNNASSRCGTRAPSRNTSSDVEDFGGVRVIMKGGRIVAAFAGRDDYRPKKKTRRASSFAYAVPEEKKPEKVEKTGEEIIRDRRRRRKEAKLTRWLQPLPANHWGRSREGDDSLTHDPITGRRYDELPAAQKDAMVRQRLVNLQKRVAQLPSYLQEEVMFGLTSDSWPWHRMSQMVRRLIRAEREMLVPRRFFLGVVEQQVAA